MSAIDWDFPPKMHFLDSLKEAPPLNAWFLSLFYHIFFNLILWFFNQTHLLYFYYLYEVVYLFLEFLYIF